MNHTFRTLKGQVRALLTKILHNTQDNKTATVRHPSWLRTASIQCNRTALSKVKSLFRLVCNIFSVQARSVFKILSVLPAHGRMHFTPRWRTTAGQAWLRGAAGYRVDPSPAQPDGCDAHMPASLNLVQVTRISVVWKTNTLHSTCQKTGVRQSSDIWTISREGAEGSIFKTLFYRRKTKSQHPIRAGKANCTTGSISSCELQVNTAFS